MPQQIGNSNLLRAWANNGTVVIPADAKIDEGWLRGEQPPHEWMNYIHNVLGQKVNHALSRGAADWNSGTEYLAGAIVNHDGELWLALAPNDNSEPSESNADWTLVSTDKNSILQGGIVVTVGSGGDFATISDALQSLSRISQRALTSFADLAEVRLLSGFEMAEQVRLFSSDLSWIKLTSEDAEVPIIRSALTTAAATGIFPAFFSTNASVLPIIEAQFSMDTSGSASGRNGIWVRGGGGPFIISGGVKNAGGDGFRADRGAVGVISGSDFSGALGRGANVISSFINASGANLSGANTFGIHSRRGSVVNFGGGNAQIGGSPGSTDITVEEGSIIAAHGSTGGTNVTVNTVTSSGIIFS